MLGWKSRFNDRFFVAMVICTQLHSNLEGWLCRMCDVRMESGGGEEEMLGLGGNAWIVMRVLARFH